MKNFSFFSFIAVFVFTGCSKEPVADFTSANYSYHAGETIHFKNTSIDAYNYKWTAPNGNTYTDKDLDYATDVNDTGGTYKFSLEASSKNSSKKNSVTKTVLLKQAILSTDYFSVNGTTYKPTDKSLITSSSSYWGIYAPNNNNTYLELYFRVPGPPIAGTYSLVSSNFSLTSTQANVRIEDQINFHYSYSGQLTVTIPSAGKIRAVFNNANDGSGNLLSGDITIH